MHSCLSYGGDSLNVDPLLIILCNELNREAFNGVDLLLNIRCEMWLSWRVPPQMKSLFTPSRPLLLSA
jgi:hypothetical protein